VATVVLTLDSQGKSIKPHTNPIKMILFLNSLLKQQSTQLPAMKAVNSHANF
jgi:hypothetical protein